MKKNNTWNIRRLVDESFVPATQRIILKIVGFQLKTIEDWTRKGANTSLCTGQEEGTAMS